MLRYGEVRAVSIGRLPPSSDTFEGGEIMHNPGHIREAFIGALEDYLLGTSQALDNFWYDEAMQRSWDGWSPSQRLWWIAGKLWRCTDTMPGDVWEVLDMQPGSTYAQAARRIRQGLVAPLQPV